MMKIDVRILLLFLNPSGTKSLLQRKFGKANAKNEFMSILYNYLVLLQYDTTRQIDDDQIKDI